MVNQPSMQNDLNQPKNSQHLRFSLDARGRLVATDAQAREHVGVTLIRLFPITDPNNWIAVFDSHGHELGCIESCQTLPSECGDAVAKALTESEFVPIIKRVLHISGNDPPCRWEVETDRGTTELIITDEKNLRRISTWRVLISDAHGIRFLVPDVRQLNAFGRNAVEWHV